MRRRDRNERPPNEAGTPPALAGGRALAAAAWLLTALAGLITAVWALGWALGGGEQPSLSTVEQSVHLSFPGGTEVVDADLSQSQPPLPGDQSEVTVHVPVDAFGDFIDANGMETPLLSGTTPAGNASGTIPADCTDEVCYSATVVVTDDYVTVDLTATLV